MSQPRLFPDDVPAQQWRVFPADGFDREAVGVIFRSGQATCGIPLGGIATGHVHLDTDGTLGACTLFNTIIPPRELGAWPFLALTVNGETWALTTTAVPGIRTAREIRYWGHYPVADLTYEMDAPLEMGLRAWSPFLPGDAGKSNIPAVVFELRLSNPSRAEQRGSVVMTFPGPGEDEIGPDRPRRKNIELEQFCGIGIELGEHADYCLGVIGSGELRTGGALNADAGAWSTLAAGLPASCDDEPGASVSVDFDLAPGASTSVRFILAWYFPHMTVQARHQYVHAYAARFANAVEVATMMAREHASLLRRVIAWQEVVYQEPSLPEWLRDGLVNNFHLIAKNAFWERNSVPPETWAREYGMFSMVESIRTWPGQACIPSDWFGNLPIVYFFPELAHSTLRGFAHYQLPNGEIPIYFGQNYERQNPVYQFLHVTSSGNYVDLVDRLWRRTGSAALLYEFYPSVKKAVEYLRGLDRDADGLIDCQPGASGNQFHGPWHWQGAAVHVAGLWLSVLGMAERMAESMGDSSFAADCRVWLKLGRQSLEAKLWQGSHYLLYNDTQQGLQDDTILANQLAGLWSCRLHGIEDAFPADRIQQTLATIQRVCVPASRCGAAVARRPDGSPNRDGQFLSTDIFVAECMVLASTLLYAGDGATGLEIARQLLEAIVIENRRPWDMPGFLDNETGAATYGNDFDQMLALWSLPAALAHQDLAESVARNGLVARMIRAASAETTC